MKTRSHPDRLLAFSHIPKTAGTTLNHLLHHHFGVRHIAVEFRRPPVVYTKRDLAVDLKIYPFAKSIAGHALKAFVDFGEFEQRLQWYTLLRDPIKRFLSHYQHQISGGVPVHQLPFQEWMRLHDRQNWMVRMIAGEEDVAAAKEVLRDKFRFVGLVERFDESLLLLRHHLDLPGFEVDYPAPANRASSNQARREVEEHFDRFREQIVENNELDLELYAFVKDVIWPEQVKHYGEMQLQQDVEVVFKRQKPGLGASLNRFSYLVYRNVVYKPFLWFDRRSNQ